jgi:uncharacterized protein HemX
MKTRGKWIVGLALSGAFLIGSATPALADGRDRYWRERDKCERRIDKAQEKLQKEIYKHGRYSHQAEQKRRELWEVQQQCRWTRSGDRDDWRNHRGDHDWDDGYRR